MHAINSEATTSSTFPSIVCFKFVGLAAQRTYNPSLNVASKHRRCGPLGLMVQSMFNLANQVGPYGKLSVTPLMI